MPTPLSALITLLIALTGLSLPVMSHAQDTPLIHACVDARGGLRIVAPSTTCTAKEARLTWPAAPTNPTTWYQQMSATHPVAQGFVTALALCDDPEDVATGGGFRLEGTFLEDSTSAVVTSTSCAASGLCGGASGQDGWVVVAKSLNTAAVGTRITAYVICARP